MTLAFDANDYFVFDGYCLAPQQFDDIQVCNGLALLTGNSWQIWDVSDPVHPVILSEVPYADRDSDAPCLTRDKIYLVNDDQLMTLDISDPESPQYIGFSVLNWESKLNHIIVKNDVAYAIGRYNRYGVDIADPFMPKIFWESNDSLVGVDIAVSKNRLYVSNTHSIRIFSIENPRVPELQGVIYDYPIQHFACSGNLIAFSTTDYSEIWDVTNGWNPKRLGPRSLYSRGQPYFSADRQMLILVNDNWWDAYDIKNPAVPVQLWTKEFDRYSTTRSDGVYLYRLVEGLEIYRIGKNAPELVHPAPLRPDMEFQKMVKSSSNLAAVSTSDSTIFFDTDAVCNQGIQSSIPFAFQTAAFAGQTGFAAAGKNGLIFYDVTDASSPKVKAMFSSMRPEKLKISNHQMVVWDNAFPGGVTWLDLTDFFNPQISGTKDWDGEVLDFHLASDICYVLLNLDEKPVLTAVLSEPPFNTLWQIEIQPAESIYELTGQIEQYDDVLYLRCDNQIIGIEINGRESPERIETGWGVRGDSIQIDDSLKLLFVSYNNNRVRLLSLENKWHPKLLMDSYPTSNDSITNLFQDGILFCVGYEFIARLAFQIVPKIEMAGWTMTQAGTQYHIRGQAQVSGPGVMRLEVMADGRTGILFNDDGVDGDAIAGDSIFTLDTMVNSPVTSGEYLINLSVSDQTGRTRYWPDLEVPRY